jgi:hypothetical protein
VVEHHAVDGSEYPTAGYEHTMQLTHRGVGVVEMVEHLCADARVDAVVAAADVEHALASGRLPLTVRPIRERTAEPPAWQQAKRLPVTAWPDAGGRGHDVSPPGGRGFAVPTRVDPQVAVIDEGVRGCGVRGWRRSRIERLLLGEKLTYRGHSKRAAEREQVEPVGRVEVAGPADQCGRTARC